MNRKGVIHTVLLMLAVTLLVLPVSGAFAVTDIFPEEGLNNGSVFISNLAGTDLPTDASVNLMLANQTNITGQFVFWESATRITCLLDLTGKKAGTWDVVVVNNTDGSEAVLSPGFTVKNPAPTLHAIDPPVGINNGTVTITNLSGTGFLADATVNLTDGNTTIIGTDVVVILPGTQVACKFDINGAVPGFWDVVFTNEDGQSVVLIDGFQVTFPPPEVHAITPATGKNNEVIGITNLSGANFMGGATVHLAKANKSDIPTINAPIVQPDKILCFFDLTDAAVGAWDVVVTNTVDGQSGVLAGGFSIFYPQAPTVTGIDPDNDENDAKVSVLITGTGFEHGAITTLSRGLLPDIPGTNVTRINATAISCDFNITGAETGAWNVTVENDDGQGFTRSALFTVRNPAPVIDDIDPEEGLTSELSKEITLTGSWFKDGASIVLMKGGAANITAAVIAVDPTEVTCTVNLTGAEPGDWSVVLTNPDGQWAVSPVPFTVSHPAPEIGTITPDSGITGETVPTTITGNWFQQGATVNLTMGAELIPATVTGTMVSEITCSFNLTGADPGAWDLEVTNPDGKSAVLADAFTIYGLPPVITPPVVPQFGFTGETSQPLVITGSNFRPGLTVNLTRGNDTITGAVAGIPTPTIINCFFNLTDAAVGTWDVVVTNDDGQEGSLDEGFFIYYPAAPVVLGIDPAVGVNTGIVPITNLSGTGFEYGASVTLMKDDQANITGTEVIVAGPGQITCNLNLTGAAVGLWNVVVTNDDGKSGVLEDGFEVRYPAPAISGFSPVKGINTGDVSITISGEYFRSPALVWLIKQGQTEIIGTGVEVVNETTITCILPLAGKATGDWSLVVINPDWQYDIAPIPFRVENPAPTFDSITPAKGPNDGQVNISALIGTGFQPDAVVLLNRTGYADIAATNITVVNQTFINCTFNLTGRAIGDWNVVIVNLADGKAGGRRNAFEITLPLPVPGFTANPVRGTAPLMVQFTDNSTNNPILWRWDFGDGSVVTGSNQQNPVHTYNEPGVYTVYLTVFNSAGESLTPATGVITVVLTPVANFTAEPLSGTAPLLVQFTDISDGSPTRWFWRFGDGTTSREKNPYHLYEKPGLYTVVLTVYNQFGSDTTIGKDMIEVRSVPVASFTANRTSGTSPLAVKFTDTSSGSPTSWSWKFGDSGSSMQQNPVYVFENTGTYSVQLTVSNGDGTSTETRHGYIVVGDIMRADFDFTTGNPENTAPLTVAFMDRSSGRPDTYTWKFGDGYMGTGRNPIHTYTLPGTYDITLTIRGPSGTDSITKTIEVKSLLRADFVGEPTTGSAPLTVTFSDVSIGTVVTRNWIIIDYTEPQVPVSVVLIENGPKNLVYTFNTPGTYEVWLEIEGEYGAYSSKERPDYIHVLPFP
ncbi:MAG: PKD domain-containing protein [Methanoregulaceae archaeon]|jgi:PKD repeat protein